MHVSDNDEHSVALRYVSAVIREFSLESVLDVGTGTGRAVARLKSAHPYLHIVGVEPSLPLLARALTKAETLGVGLASASGYELPFADASFDVVCQFGVLHHVKEPNVVVREMIRVAKRAVFLSDSNRFGQGRMRARLLKVVLAGSGLWGAANFLKTRGTGYTISDGDGLSYSYSVFDSLEILRSWSDRIILVPTSQDEGSGWFSPLVTSSHVLVCAVRDR
jgi:SAM-dependent methyltransferase